MPPRAFTHARICMPICMPMHANMSVCIHESGVLLIGHNIYIDNGYWIWTQAFVLTNHSVNVYTTSNIISKYCIPYILAQWRRSPGCTVPRPRPPPAHGPRILYQYCGILPATTVSFRQKRARKFYIIN